MSKDIPSDQPRAGLTLLSGEQFTDWVSLNDSIMGGSSQADCTVNSDGLTLRGNLVEEGGGFVSCRSPLLSPPLNLSSYKAFQIDVEGEGRTLKFAVACRDRFFGLTEIMSGGLRWVSSVTTQVNGITKIEIPFTSLESTVRAKPVNLPFNFNSSSITQLQLLHSKFGDKGGPNPGFRPGPIRILLRSIRAIY